MSKDRRDSYVRVERHGAVAVLTLDRPPVNALELRINEHSRAALEEIAASDAGAMVVTGAGGTFSAGLDLKVVPAYGPDEQRALVAGANEMLGRLYAFPLPVVAAVNGHAIAGGLVLALACDYRVGTTAPCKLGLTEARAGIPFPAVAMAIVRAELSPAAARVLTLVARNSDAEQARALGILDELQPPERVFARALAVAEDLASMPRDAYARIKHQLRAETIARNESTIATGSDPMLESWLGPQSASASRKLLQRE